MPCVNDAFLGPTFREEPGSARRGEGQIEMKRSSASPCSWVRVLVLVLCSACSGRAEDGLPACPGADGTPGSGRLGTPAAGCVTRSLSCGVACVTGGCGVASDAEIACSSNLLSENSLEVAPSASVTYVGISQIGWARPFAIESNRIQEIEGLSFGAGVSALLVSVGADGSAHWARDHHPSGDSALAEGVVHVYPSGAGWQTESSSARPASAVRSGASLHSNSARTQPYELLHGGVRQQLRYCDSRRAKQQRPSGRARALRRLSARRGHAFAARPVFRWSRGGSIRQRARVWDARRHRSARSRPHQTWSRHWRSCGPPRTGDHAGCDSALAHGQIVGPPTCSHLGGRLQHESHRNLSSPDSLDGVVHATERHDFDNGLNAMLR
jgi:hypothetical protein